MCDVVATEAMYRAGTRAGRFGRGGGTGAGDTANSGSSVERVLDGFGKGDVLIAQAAVAVSMADKIGIFESTLARPAAGWAPSGPVSKSPALSVGMPVAPVSAPKVLAPIPMHPPLPRFLRRLRLIGSA